MKAIETVYNGYKFRSRLEARWAVFFDTLSIEYHYEPEGFDLDGLWYLPDFFLPEEGWYVEIKPTKDISNDDLEKIKRLDNDPPKNDKGELLAWGVIVLIGPPEFLEVEEKSSPYGHLGQKLKGNTAKLCGRIIPTDPKFVAKGVEAARQARFERKY